MTCMPEAVEMDVVAGPATVQRRRFPAAYRLRILKEVDACKKPGEVGPYCGARGCTRRC